MESAKGLIHDLVVVELGDDCTQYCGRLLGDMGARVIKVEPPGGAASRHRGPFKDGVADPNNSLYFWAYNTNKESVVLDYVNSPADRQKLMQLISRADILLHDLTEGHDSALGLDYETLSKTNPGLIVTAVTPFGRTGPWKDWKSSDLVIWAMGGNMWLIGYDDPATPPLCPQGDHSYIMGGHWALVGAMTALTERDANGGEGQLVDVSVQEACSMSTEWSVPDFEYQGITTKRSNFLGGAVLCADGKYFIPQAVNITPTRWEGFVDWLRKQNEGQEFWDDKYLDPDVLEPALPKVRALIAQIASKRKASELWLEGQAMGFTWTVFNAPEELLEDEQLNFRHFFQDVEHPEHGASYKYAGSPYNVPDAPWSIRRRPPLLGEDQRVAEHLLQRQSGARPF